MMEHKSTDQLIIEQFPRVQRMAFHGLVLAENTRRMLYCFDRWKQATLNAAFADDGVERLIGGGRWVLIWMRAFQHYRAHVEASLGDLTKLDAEDLTTSD